MQTHQITTYSFSELSDDAKQTALEKLWDINVAYIPWWEFVFEDAYNIGLKITEFDIDRGAYCNGQLTENAHDVAQNILRDHGESCDTHALATQFMADWNTLVEKYSDGIDTNRVTENNEYDFDQEADKLEADFEYSLREEYLSLLRREFEYLTSEEAVRETIEANEYQFLETGKQY